METKKEEKVLINEFSVQCHGSDYSTYLEVGRLSDWVAIMVFDLHTVHSAVYCTSTLPACYIPADVLYYQRAFSRKFV